MSRSTALLPLLATGLALGATGCATKPTPQEAELMDLARTREIAPATIQERVDVRAQDPITQAAFWGNEFEKNPADLEAAIEFSTVLRAIGSDDRAVEVSASALGVHPGNVPLLTLLGKSLLATGDPSAAVDALKSAHLSSPADASILGALGVAYDQTGRHQAAQDAYQKALGLAPRRASLHSNLGLSLLFTGDPDKAEQHLRTAVSLPEAGPRERANLAMALSVQGKFDEARTVSAADLPDELVDANLDYFRAMLTPQRRWSGLRGSLE